MAIVTLGDLLDRANQFEQQLAERYATIRDGAEDNGVRLLTYYLARHRRHQQQALGDLSPEQLRLLRRIELKHDVAFHPEKKFTVLRALPDEITGHSLLEAAAAYDAELVGLYRSILEQPLSEEARAVIEALIRIEERDIVMIKKMIAMDYF